MKLTIANKQVVLPKDARISIQRSSPLMNEDTGSYSYPFPVPTAPNQQALCWPGKLQRTGDIADQSFILEHSGMQIFSGEVDYDSVNKNEIGVILKSGQTLFRSKVEGKYLSEIDYGSESWLPEFYLSFDVTARLALWDAANTTNNGKYIVAPAIVNPVREDVPLYVNRIDKTTGKLRYNPQFMVQEQLYMLQFRAYFVLEKIFASAGYTILENELKSGEFSGLVIFSQIINIPMVFGTPSTQPTTLYYAKLMPVITVLEFIDNIANLLCMVYDIDERKKTVRIIFKKNLFATGNIEALKIVELAGWEHSEKRVAGGFKLSYRTQDDELDTYTDFPNIIDVVIVLPAPVKDGQIVRLLSDQRDYITVSDGGVKSWKQVGRLREISIGNGSEKVELAVKIPRAVAHSDGYVIPKLEFIPTTETINLSAINRLQFEAISELIVSLYHGLKDVGSVGIPYTSGDRWGITDGWSVGVSTYLSPEYLYQKVYSEFLNWKGYRARAFTKYIELTLAQVLSLRWDKTYVVDGVEIILDKINFEIPHYGTVRIDGYTG